MYIFSVGFYQMSKIAVTPSIVLAEFVLYGKRVSLMKVIGIWENIFSYFFMTTYYYDKMALCCAILCAW